MLRATTESAVRAALTTVADTGTAVAIHTAHVATTPIRAASNAALAVGIGLATTLIVSTVEYAAAGLWWLGSSLGNLAWAGTAAIGSTAYASIFGSPQPKMIAWHSNDELFMPSSKSHEDSSRLLEITPPQSPRPNSVADID